METKHLPHGEDATGSMHEQLIEGPLFLMIGHGQFSRSSTSNLLFFFFFLWHVWLISESNQRFLFSILLLRLHTEVLRFQYYYFSRSLPEPYITWVGVVYNHWWTIGPALTYQHLSQLFFSFQRCWVTIRTLEASNCISHRFHDKSMQHFSDRICIFPKLIPAFVSIKLVRASLVGRIN